MKVRGEAVFEGERAYSGVIYKCTEHSERLKRSANILDFEIPYSVADIDAGDRDALIRLAAPLSRAVIELDFAGVIQKHPLTKDYQLRVTTKRKDPMEVIQDASSSAQEYSKELLSMIKSAVKK